MWMANVLFFVCFKDLVIFIGKSDIQRRGETERKEDLLSDVSLPKQLQKPELCQSGARSQEPSPGLLKAVGRP